MRRLDRIADGHRHSRGHGRLSAIRIWQVCIARRPGELGRLDLAAVWSRPVRGVLDTIADRQRALRQWRPLRLRGRLAVLVHHRRGQRGVATLRRLAGLASCRQALTGQALSRKALTGKTLTGKTLTGKTLTRQILAR